MKQLQIEHREWVNRKYPNQRPKIPAVGCLEEAGELVHAILKIELVETWGEDSRHKFPALRVKLVDAIGDCGIYACSLCNANQWDFQENWDCTDYTLTEESNPLDTAILLVQSATELALNPGSHEKLHGYLTQLKSVAWLLGLHAETAIRTTWQEVKCR